MTLDELQKFIDSLEERLAREREDEETDDLEKLGEELEELERDNPNKKWLTVPAPKNRGAGLRSKGTSTRK